MAWGLFNVRAAWYARSRCCSAREYSARASRKWEKALTPRTSSACIPRSKAICNAARILSLLLKYIVVSGICGHVIDKMGHHTLVGRAVVQVKQGIVGDALMEHIAAWPMTFQQSGVGQ